MVRGEKGREAKASRWARWRRNGRAACLKIARFRDCPRRISIGLSSGIFMSFLPFFGLHFVLSLGMAYVLGGNLRASLLGTAAGNPITFPVIATSSVTLGNDLLGRTGEAVAEPIAALKNAAGELWANLGQVLTGGAGDLQWAAIAEVWSVVFLPYVLGGLVFGGIVSFAAFHGLKRAIAGFRAARQARITAAV